MPDEKEKTGFLLIDKPRSWTSFDVVKKLRRITGIKTIGHAGTLDPFATGLLIIGIGRPATRRIGEFMKLNKTYEAVLRLGAVSSTLDPEGVIIKNAAEPGPAPGIDDIRKTLKTFLGAQEQIPPMFSAKKIGGKKLYQLARQGKTVKREPAAIAIGKIEISKYSWPELGLKIRCSSGAYVRVLAADIGEALRVGAYLTALRRTSIGNYGIDEAKRIEEFDENNWVEALRNFDSETAAVSGS